jgi:hypothetical protein
MKQMFCLLALGSILWAIPSLAAPSPLCYLLANNATAPFNTPYTPDSRSAFNASGGAISVTHVSPGVYTVVCYGLGSGFGLETVGNVQVTANGDSNIECHVNGWASGSLIFEAPATSNIIRPPPPVFSPRFTASVLCFGPGGGTGGGPKAADSEFTLLFVD